MLILRTSTTSPFVRKVRIAANILGLMDTPTSGRFHFEGVDVRAMDDKRLKEMIETTRELKALNRDIWNFLPYLDAHLNGTQPNAEGRSVRSKSAKRSP